MPDEAIASPLTLLVEEQEAAEVLVLSYTLNLDFWERYALSVARGLRARVTVVGDAQMVTGDPAHVRYAGVTYLDGRAVCRRGGAFHPKLVVIAAKTYATVAIGSGNATVPGWHDNAELWTVLRGDESGAPATFADLAIWLRGLLSEIAFSAGVVDALARVAKLLDSLPATESGPELVSSLNRRIMDQIPVGQVGELLVAAPFHDRESRALAELVKRLSPGSLAVLLQPKDAVVDGASLASLLPTANGEAHAIVGDRYHHGKLYEWTVGDRRFAMTGSPNLSSAALQLSMARGGNCELALISEIDQSIAPATGVVLGAELAMIAYKLREPAPPAITLFGASRSEKEQGIVLLIRGGLLEAGALEWLRNDVWEAVDEVPAGLETVEISGFFDAGTAIRVRAGEVVSNVCFVTDLSRVKRARIEQKGRTNTGEVAIFDDPKLAEAFALDLAELRSSLATGTGRGGTRGGGAGGGVGVGAVSFESWEDYLDHCASRIGDRLLAYGLALPALSRGEEDYEDPGEEDEPLPGEGGEPGASGGKGGLTPRPEPLEPPLPVFDDRAETERRRYRRWCERLVEVSPELVPAGRLVALRLVLRAVSGGLFANPSDWVPLVAGATEALGELPKQTFEEERDTAASMAALALTLMRAHIDGFSSWPPLRFPYERAATAADPLLPFVDDDRIDRIAAELRTAFPGAVGHSAIRYLIDAREHPDALEEALRAATEQLGLSVERNGRVLRVYKTVAGDPRRTLLRVVGLAEKDAVGVAIHAVGGKAIAAWVSPHLVVTRPTAMGVGGALYVLRGFGPSAYWDDLSSLPKPVATWSQLGGEPDEARAVLELVGLLRSSAE